MTDPEAETMTAADFLRSLAEAHPSDPVFAAGVTASCQTLNAGVIQRTAMCHDPELRRKHAARLSAALLAMADAMGVV